MAVGDCYSVLLGTGTVTRQPASGVFEQISSVVHYGTSDQLLIYDGTNSVVLIDSSMQTGTPESDVNSPRYNPYNGAHLSGNTVYIQKAGTTDRFGISGVQVDA